MAGRQFGPLCRKNLRAVEYVTVTDTDAHGGRWRVRFRQPHRDLAESLAAGRSRYRGRLSGRQPYAAACRVISEISVRLSPLVVPRVEIHTSTLEVLVRLCTAMRLCPGRSEMFGVSSTVSANLAGASVVDERICTWVPVLDTSIVTALSAVGSDRCSSRPMPSMNFGKGSGSL